MGTQIEGVLLWGPLLGVLHARVTSRLGEIGWKFESTLGCVCVAARKSGMLRSPKTTPLPPFEDAGGFVVALPGLGAWPGFRASSGS